ncbi:HDOD domain-containing protein [Glaciecola sp. MH2013]|uniref:HDOD domain-containing protein n=1 Tax=Glaciecola sp. MH2013 TaxID=2785524 RepID=UPI00189CA4B9|nr:HDOD domain-containing protein [Glaciecola sp. MH2013]MBF7072071.1 HDOD domain-containing protein [Glaciecola sp. MH2013]
MSIKPLVKFASKSFTLPDTCVNLRAALDDPKKDLTDIAQLIAVDPSLSAKILKLANSALFRFPSQIETVSKALNVIGGEAAYNISIAETANIAFKTFNTSVMNFSEYWNNAVMCGVIAKSIAQQKQSRGSERFFVLGILQGLSELIVASKHADKYKSFQNDLEAKAPLVKQKDYFGFTFPQCSGQIIQEWKLPQSLVLPLQKLAHPPSEKLQLEESILYVAIAMAICEQKDYELDDLPGFNKQALDTVSLSDDDYDMILNYSRLETSKIANLINS